jgi:hypothetical protein
MSVQQINTKLRPPDRPTPGRCNVCGCNPDVQLKAFVRSYHNRKRTKLWMWSCPGHPLAVLEKPGYHTPQEAANAARCHLAYEHGVWR